MRKFSQRAAIIVMLWCAGCTEPTAVVDAGDDDAGARSDAGREVDAGGSDGGVDAGPEDASFDAGRDADGGRDAGLPAPVGWLRSVAGDAFDQARAVAATSRRIYVGGTAEGHVDFGDDPSGDPIEDDFFQDAFIVAYDREGRPLWHKRYGTGAGRDVVNELAVDGAGNLYAAGVWSGTLDFGDGTMRTPTGGVGFDVFVLSLDPEGTLRWVYTYGADDAQSEEVGALAVDDASATVIVGGTHPDDTNFGGGVRMIQSMAGLSGYDGHIVALSTDGTYRWDQVMRARGYAAVYALAIDPTTADVLVGGMVGESTWEPIAGRIETSRVPGDAFLIRYSPTATAIRWLQRFGNTGTDGYTLVTTIALSGDTVYAGGTGRVDFTIGSFSFSSAGDYDGFLLSFAGASGALNWGLAVRGSGGADGVSAVGAAGNIVYAAGEYGTTARVRIGADETTTISGPIGPRDVFLLRLMDTGPSPMIAGPIETLGTTAEDAVYSLELSEVDVPIITGSVSASGAMQEGTTLGFGGGTSDGFVWRHVD